MLQYLIWLMFILSVAMAAGSVVLAARLRNKYKSDIFSILLYFQVFIYTFGFYGIWGQVVINTFLSSYISPELMARFSDIALVLGVPFLIFAWLMLIQFSYGISGRKTSNWFISSFLFLNISLLILVGYIMTKSNPAKTISLIRYYYILMNLIYTLFASFLITLPRKGKSVINKSDKRIIAPVMLVIMLAQCLLLLLLSSHSYIRLIFVFVFFAGNTFLPLYLSYGAILSGFIVEPVRNITFEEFCRKFEVSPRETDIVREICNGLSNKEISDKLFISLQTVKDHTHRIYIKTNVKSRVQLINLVKELKIL